MSFYLFIDCYFLVLTSLRHYCNILFVALLIPLSYEDKMFGTALSNSQLTRPLTSDIYDSNFKAHICAEGGRFKLMTEINLVEKRNNIRREHLP